MNKAQKRPTMTKVLSMILALIMVLSLLPLSGFTADTQAADTSVLENRIVHLDCGRKYFSVENIKALIDGMYSAGYNQLQLAFGNSGLRFLLGDMSLSFDVNGKTVTYDSNTMVNNIKLGNLKQNNSGDETYLSQDDMDEIIRYAENKNVEIVPLLNMPGHMNAVLYAFESYRIKGYTKDNELSKSSSTLDLTNDEARAFGLALLQKYVNYFKGKSSVKHFNFGADEVGNDIVNPFYSFNGGYDKCISYINACAEIINDAGMTPRAFNDYMYYNNSTSKFDANIEVCYWNNQWSNSPYASASKIANKGHKLINTNSEWYYVLGVTSSGSSAVDNNLSYALSNVQSLNYNQYHVQGSNFPTVATAGAMLCIWCDSPNASKPEKAVSDGIILMKAFAEKNASVFPTSTGEVEPTPSAEPTEPVKVPVVEGGTASVVVPNEDLRGTYATGDESIATVVTVDYKEDVETTTYVFAEKTAVSSDSNYIIKNSDGKYLKADGTLTDDISKAAEWTLSGRYNSYNLKNGSSYLKYDQGTLSTVSNPNLATSFYFNNGTLYASRGWNYSSYTYSDPIGVPGISKEITQSAPQSTITFKGIKAGETEVTIGNVKYKIIVTEKDLSNENVTVNYFITNIPVTANEKTSDSINAGDVNKEDGVDVSTLIPRTGKNSKGAEVKFWKAMYQTGSDVQTESGWTNTSDKGEKIEKLRYWNDSWAYYSSGKWEKFTPGSAALITAFYCQKTEVTDEITTYAVDWGEDITTSHTNTNISGLYNTYALLDFAVRYESGDRLPKTFSNAKTIVYNGAGQLDYAYDSDGNTRIVKEIFAENTSDFEVYMITVTKSTNQLSTTDAGNLYTLPKLTYEADSDNEKVVWVSSEEDLSSDYQSADKQYTGFTIGGEPIVPAVYVAKQYGYLITYYVRTVESESNLTVHYYERNDGRETEFYNYQISVKGNTVFDDGFAQKEQNSTELVNNTVTNSLNKTETVYADLNKVPKIAAKYRYSAYTCVEVKRSNDGKEVSLYYTFTNSITFVVDYGLPLQIPLERLNSNLKDANVTKVAFDGVTNGIATYDETTKTITYELTKPLSKNESIGVTVTGEKDEAQGMVTYSVTIIPASNVYYEDSFAKFEDGTGTAAAAQWSIEDNDGNKITENDVTVTNQALSTLGSKEIYGYDTAYKYSTKYSMGSAHKVTVSSAMANGWTDDSAWPTATFTFKGTGFDIISLTDNTSGTIFVDVYKGDKAEGEAVRSYFVDNYYGYKQVEGADRKVTWVVDKDSPNALYQIPVMKVTDLGGYDTYTVVISVEYDSFFDHTDNKEYTFVLDAIRVYNPMDKDNETYAKDDEGYPQYIKLRDKLASGNASADAVFIDGSKAETEIITNYANYGPNNEVYLAKNQAISFKIPANANIASIQIGAKAPSGTAKMNVTGTENDQEIFSATEMYYKVNVDATTVDQQVTIANNGDGILSLTNLKITFTKKSSEVKLAALTDEDQANAVATVRALFAAPTPEVKTFEPERFDASWNSVRVGQKATLTVKTSSDVEAITVNGETVDNYKTRYERSGWGWWAEKVEYRVFTYTVTATETMDYEVAAVNAEGTASEPVTCTLTVKPAQTNWWDDIWNGFFGKWF